VTAHTIFERLYLISCWGTIGKIFHHASLCAHTPTSHTATVSRSLPCLFSETLVSHFFVSTIRQVIWPSPGSGARTLQFPLHFSPPTITPPSTRRLPPPFPLPHPKTTPHTLTIPKHLPTPSIDTHIYIHVYIDMDMYVYMDMEIAIKRPRTRSPTARQVSNAQERDLVTNQNV